MLSSLTSPEVPHRTESAPGHQIRPPEGDASPSSSALPSFSDGTITHLAKSYSGTLLGPHSTAQPPPQSWICVGEKDIVSIIFDGVQAIQLSPEFKKKLCHPWSKSVVVRLVGKSIGYSFMCNRLRSMWKPQGNMQVIDVDMDCYLVRFGEEKDYFKALTGGPWMIFKHYLIVQQWDPSFRVSTKLPSKMVVWVRFPHLPI
ncbi:hypothetical protein LINPERHAP1_LOCUS1478 [Linum perenne]